MQYGNDLSKDFIEQQRLRLTFVAKCERHIQNSCSSEFEFLLQNLC